jgi:hypothetical protein
MGLIHGTTRRILVMAVAAACLAAVIGGVSFARAGGSSGPQTLVFTEVDTGGKFISVTHTQNGAPGDEFIFSAKLINGQNMRIGTLDAKCTLALHGRLLCEGTMRFRGGYVTLSGTLRADEPTGTIDRIAVTGGTGRFDQAHGQLISKSTSDTTSSDVLDID